MIKVTPETSTPIPLYPKQQSEKIPKSKPPKPQKPELGTSISTKLSMIAESGKIKTNAITLKVGYSQILEGPVES